MMALPKLLIRIRMTPGRLLMRRIRTLAGIATIGAGVLVAAGLTEMAAITSIAHAQSAPQWPGFADVVEKIKPAVISVRTRPDAGARAGKGRSPVPDETPLERFFRRFGQPDDDSRARRFRQGSGFFISPDGYAVTNSHVVDGVKTVEVTTDDSKIYTARVIGADERTDVALIKVDGRSDFPTAKFAERIPRVGDWVLAVGNPFGLGGTVTAGIVSARGRDIGAGPYDDFIQIDAPVNRGNSGGPTFDIEGNVIGVNTAIVSPSGGSVGIGFAIPADTVKSVVAQLRDKGRVTRGWIGVQIQSVTPEIAEKSRPCRGTRRAGCRAGCERPREQGRYRARRHHHRRQRQGGRRFPRTCANDQRHAAGHVGEVDLGAQGPGENGPAKTVNVTLGELPDQREAAATADDPEPKSANIPQLGLTVAPKAGSEGVVVTDVDADGTAAEHGLKVGDVILDAGGKKVTNVADLRNAVQAVEKSGKRTVLMRVRSGTSARYVTLPVGRG